MTDRTRYEAVLRRDEACWLITFPEVPGAGARIDSLDHVDATARLAIASVLGVDEESIEVTVLLRHREPRGPASSGA